METKSSEEKYCCFQVLEKQNSIVFDKNFQGVIVPNRDEAKMFAIGDLVSNINKYYILYKNADKRLKERENKKMDISKE